MCYTYYNFIIILYFGILFTYMTHTNGRVLYKI